ncbi:MAG TPA: sugar kinase [Armatimonadota bacterium]|jgi:5-dehydro-2-deoxygluconokinase
MDAIHSSNRPARASSTPPLDVLVLGSLFVELTPEQPGQPLSQAQRLIPTASGAAANFAQVLAALGARVGMLTRVGDDEMGRWLRDQLSAAGLDTSAILTTAAELTPVSFASADLCGGKQFFFYRFPGWSDPLATFSPADLSHDQVTGARLFDFTEAVIRSEGVRASAFQAARWCREAGRQVAYAINYRPQSWACPPPEMIEAQRQACALADLVFMNEEESQLLFGPDVCIEKVMQSYTDSAGTIFVITAGERGGWVCQGGSREPFTAPQVTVQYDVGAGDTFHAAFVAAHLAGQSPRVSAAFAAACAALKISRPASAPPPTWEETIRFLPA